MSGMNSAALATMDKAGAIEAALVEGDLSKLTTEERVVYYMRMCASAGLNPTTKPFDYLKLNGKLILYANKGCTDQLRSLHRVSIAIVARENVGDVYVVTSRASLPDGRTDESTGAVACAGLRGEALANALMKAETKSKRRVTLSACGLGLLDESEVETIKGAEKYVEGERPASPVAAMPRLAAKPETSEAPDFETIDFWVGRIEKATTPEEYGQLTMECQSELGRGPTLVAISGKMAPIKARLGMKS